VAAMTSRENQEFKQIVATKTAFSCMPLSEQVISINTGQAMEWYRLCQIFLIAYLHISFAHSSADTKKNVTTILVSMDGVGWQFLDSDITDTPNFDFVARTGVKAKNMITVNPTSTFPVHTTLVTGLYPESHGIISNTFYDPVYDEEFYLENDCSNFDPKFHNDSEPIWLTMEKRGRTTGTYFWPSSTSYDRRPSYFANHICEFNCSDYSGEKLKQLRQRVGRQHCKFDWFEDPYWNRIETALRWMKSDSPPGLILLYFEQADYKGHKYGPNSPYYWKSIESQDRYVVGYLIDKLRESNLLETTNLIFVSDHSMIETSNEKQIDLFKVVDPSSYKYWWPGIWPEPGKLEEVYKNLTLLNNAHFKVYKKKDIPEEYHWKHNRRVPPIFFDVENGWQLRKTEYDRNTEGSWRKGSHGWPASQESAAIFYAMGPAFKKGYNFTGSLRAVDIYPLLCQLLDVEPLPNNGSLDNMMYLLANETEAARINKSKCITTSLVVLSLSFVIIIISI
jgi:predicted AlkP superfamily pyrophosphatase or phosphodiesterase